MPEALARFTRSNVFKHKQYINIILTFRKHSYRTFLKDLLISYVSNHLNIICIFDIEMFFFLINFDIYIILFVNKNICNFV